MAAPVVQLVAFTPWFVFPRRGLPAGAAGRRPWLALPAGALLALQLLWLFPPDQVADRFLARQTDPLRATEHGQAQAAARRPN